MFGLLFTLILFRVFVLIWLVDCGWFGSCINSVACLFWFCVFLLISFFDCVYCCSLILFFVVVFCCSFGVVALVWLLQIWCFMTLCICWCLVLFLLFYWFALRVCLLFMCLFDFCLCCLNVVYRCCLVTRCVVLGSIAVVRMLFRDWPLVIYWCVRLFALLVYVWLFAGWMCWLDVWLFTL